MSDVTSTHENARSDDVQFHESSDGLVQLAVRTDSDTVWLTRQQWRRCPVAT